MSKTLQKEKIAGIQGKQVANLTVRTLKGMNNERDFSLFYEKNKTFASEIEAISTPSVPRKRRRADYSILHYVTGNPRGTGEAYHPANAYDHFKPIYLEALDSIINAIKERFNQPAFELFSQVEQLFLKAIIKEDHSEELKVLATNFQGDYNADSITAELQLLPTIFEKSPPINLEDVVSVIKPLSHEKRVLIRNDLVIIRLILTNGATSATPERSFSLLKRI